MSDRDRFEMRGNLNPLARKLVNRHIKLRAQRKPVGLQRSHRLEDDIEVRTGGIEPHSPPPVVRTSSERRLPIEMRVNLYVQPKFARILDARVDVRRIV